MRRNFVDAHFDNEEDCRFVQEIADVLRSDSPVAAAVARLIRQGAPVQYYRGGRAVTYPGKIELEGKR